MRSTSLKRGVNERGPVRSGRSILFGLLCGFRRDRAPFFDALFDFLLDALIAWPVITFGFSQIILRNVMLGKVMSVFVAFAVAEALCALVMRVTQVLGHGKGTARLNIFQGAINRDDGAVAFMSRRDVKCGFGEWNACLRPANEFGGLKSGIGQDQGHGISKPTSSAAWM